MGNVGGLEEERHTRQSDGIFRLGAQDLEKNIGKPSMRLGLGVNDTILVTRTHGKHTTSIQHPAAAAGDRSNACGASQETRTAGLGTDTPA